jgi:hypothetical protein
MNSASLFCIPATNYCNLMSEWAVYWQAVAAVATIVFGTVGLIKILQELRRLNEQRAKELEDKETSARLKRTEFFLSQHRRLFDNSELYEVLCLIDSDSVLLANEAMWDKKRKFLTFFEEIALLIDSDQIRSDVAHYMFGYYARCAREGKNFGIGIDLSPEHWGLFYKFAEDSDTFSKQYANGPRALTL